METITLNITCNGTEDQIIQALKELVEGYEQSGCIYDSEDATVMAEIQ